MIKICKKCGKEISPVLANNQKFCDECRNTKCSVDGCEKMALTCTDMCTVHERKERRNKNKIIHTKICQNCDREFKTPYSRQIHCSNECLIIFNNNRKNNRNREKSLQKKIEKGYKKCAICQNEFLPTTLRTGLYGSEQIYCSKECKEEGHKITGANYYKSVTKLKLGHLDRGDSFPQRFIFNTLKEKFSNLNWEYNDSKTIRNPETNYPLELDIWCKEIKLAVEYDGELHFYPKYGKERLIYVQKLDSIKSEICKDKDIRLVRFNINDDWRNKDFIINKIGEIINGNY